MTDQPVTDQAWLIALARPEIRALTPYASARALADSAGLLLNANENPWPPAGDDGLQLNRYPDPQPDDLRVELARRFDVDREQILITRGSDEGIDLLMRGFCRPAEDRVLICPPCFGMYALSARIQGARLVEVPLIDQGETWALDRDRVEATGAVKLTFLCSPNNPTGNEISAETVRGLCRARERQGLVVVDEAYIEFSDAASMTALIEDHPNLVILRTLSKAYALAGCRIGVLIADPDVIGLLRRIIAPYPLPTPSVVAARRALADPTRLAGQLATLDDQKRRLVACLGSLPGIVRLWGGSANFILIRVADAADLVEAASARGIRLRNQSAQHGLANCVRITIGTPEETTALIDFLQRYFKHPEGSS
jgi:histidinol-phosphate aminotransferase